MRKECSLLQSNSHTRITKEAEEMIEKWRRKRRIIFSAQMSNLGTQCWHSDILNSSIIFEAIRHVTIPSWSPACQVPTSICLFPTEIFHPQSRHLLHQSIWSPHFLWNDSLLLQQTSTMSYSWDSLFLSSCALPGRYLPSLLPQSLSFSVSVFSSSVLRHTHTLVTSSLLLDLKIHTWLSLCLLSPLHMVLSSQSHVTSISLHHSSCFPGHVESTTHVSYPCYPATNMDETVL